MISVMDKNCQMCGATILGVRNTRKFCLACRKKRNAAHVRAWREQKKNPPVVTGA